jgi:signal recognition particle receptor subunit beta
MPALENDQLVVRVVYTGPPLAGKTRSVRALMPLLQGKGADEAVMSPGEWRGRTAFFDFADYVGGAFEGKPIRCQILSTPGQVALSDRRELLLRAADAVIMVVDSQPEGLERALQSYEEMEPWLADAGRDVPIRLILQCNKQDLPDAIPSDEIGRILGLPCGKDVYATSAHTGKGLRVAFVAGVRNAVERARALVAKGVSLDTLEIESGEELFGRMRREVAPLGSIQPMPSSAHATARAKRVASPSARAPSAGRSEGKPFPVASSAASVHPSARPARAPTKPSESGLYPSASRRTTVASRPTSPPGGGCVPRLKPSEPAPAGNAHPFTRQLGNPKASSAPSSGGGRPAPRRSREPEATSPRAPAAGRPPLGERGPAATGAGRQERARAARPASASSASVSAGSAATARRAASRGGADAVPVRASARREAVPASSARQAILLPPAESLPPTPASRQAAREAAAAPRSSARPAVMPASAWKQALAAAEAKAWQGAPDPPASARTALSSDTPSWEVAPPDDASWELDPSGAASSEAAALPVAAANAGSSNPAGENASPEAEPSRSPSLESPPSETERYRVTRASTHGLELSEWMPVDEPSESFRIPETPPGLQAFVAASRRALFRHPATEQGGDERNEHAPGAAASVNTASELPLPNATPSEGVAGTLPVEPTAALPVNSCVEPSAHLDSDSDSRGERLDSVRAMSLAPTPREDETPPFSFPGPRLPGQARIPQAVWPRACWRTLETQVTAYASAISDARGRWIGELAPGWFARTLRKAPDERVARRAFAEQVLRERKLGRYLSRPRCVVLTGETDGFWIWQVACRVPTLATILRPRLGAGESPSEMAGALLDAALGYLDARQRFVEARVPLPLSPHALSFQEGKIVYSGLMPDPGAVFVEPAGNGYAAFQDALRKMWPGAPVDAPAVLAELHGKAAGRLPEPLIEIIRSVVDQR